MASVETVKIVCLANSRKISGRCIVGKIVESNKWIRPVSSRENEEISEEERRYKNGKMPKLLDIISIPIKYYSPKLFQNENYLIDDGYYWKKQGLFIENMENLLDTPADLWGTLSSSYQGTFDRIPENNCTDYTNSLYLIKVESLKIVVRVEGEEFDNAKRKVRAKFKYKNIDYFFPITDPIIEKEYLLKEDGTFKLSTENKYLCVSLGLPFNGYCYKFLASIIETK